MNTITLTINDRKITIEPDELFPVPETLVFLTGLLGEARRDKLKVESAIVILRANVYDQILGRDKKASEWKCRTVFQIDKRYADLQEALGECVRTVTVLEGICKATEIAIGGATNADKD